MTKKQAGMKSAFFIFSLLCLAVAALCLAAEGAFAAHGKKGSREPQTFDIPGDAVVSMLDAVKAGNTAKLAGIFGGDAKAMFSSGDATADRLDLENFIREYGEQHSIRYESRNKAILYVGKDEWPFPVPLVRKGGKWRFDSRAGKEEVANRRIGRNEFNAIDVMHAYVDAQREYASKDRDGDGILEYAQKIVSEKRKKDGLFWDTDGNGEESPIGPFIADASREGYGAEKGGGLTPFHGYYFRILKAQGANAEGGAYDYVVNDNMILGFAMIAWPARYGYSGVMTFMVNQSGVVYEKDLGKETDNTALSIKAYDPDKTWKKVGKEDLTAPRSVLK
jgi:hypothetical protein